MTKYIFIFLLIAQTGCAALKPYNSEQSETIAIPEEEGVSAVAILEYLPDGLQVTFEVKDDELVSEPEKELWYSDGVELYMDLRAYRQRAINFNSPGVFQLMVRPQIGDVPLKWRFFTFGLPIPEGFHADSVETEDGYIVQVFLPEESFSEIHGPFRETLYVDVAVNDVNADGSRKKRFWKGNNNNWQHPHNFAPVTFP